MSVSSFQFTVIGVAAMLVVGGLIWFGTGADEPPAIGLAPPVGDDDSGITVHVAGAVVAPGLVTVPSNARIADALARAGGAAWNADLTSVNLAARVRDGERVIVPIASNGPHAGGVGDASEGVDLNTASASELTTLPGVGPVLAARIIEYRTERGPFTEMEDLLEVSGIGESRLALLREHIRTP